MAKLTVVIVTRDSQRVLRENFTGLDRDLMDCLLIVDNGSSDGTAHLAGSMRVQVIPLRDNRGFAAAANIGAGAATTPYLCFLNPDCQPSRALFEAGVAAIVGQPDRIASPRLDEGPKGILEGRQPGYTAFKLLLDTVCTNYGGHGSRLYRWCEQRIGFHEPSWQWAHGACLFLHRQTFLELGGFDETYFLYMEDVDLGRRASSRGCRVLEIPVTVRHQSGGSCQGSTRLRRRWLNRSRRLYASRYHGQWLSGGLALLAAPAQLVRSVLGGCE
jgi:GT2 family glycosyltransferase